ncbi:Mu-like prophage major head subunit gpT family protein [Hydrogenophaga taeniospiralis]|uniref:Mu-like prophage major head subunit gpT family protein n=1 Tax=Hydrogenophaga taeniospiralis TaxID=65656 RepID=UPI001CFACA37|nr:Mu-like prophage major head subunit gpT family protein [Hydrogenophaga taeniospiralis]MCB4365408.1 Mu-like prophage major head subunit gpT family protein [Hydrogenophaga taeniospiralis]
MSAQGLSSRAIIGEFYNTLEQDMGGLWIPQVSNLFDSDQESETYKWLGQSPTMREWIGGRQAKGFTSEGVTIANKDFEATLEVLVKEMRRDKTGQVMVRVRELAQRTNAHWAKLLSQLIIAAESGVCYDGQYFFDTDHAEGDSGTQSNDLTHDVTTPTAPTAGEAEAAILKAVQAILGFKDNQGEPMNENAREFLIMTPIPLMNSVAGAIGASVIMDGASVSRTNTILTLGTLGGFTMRMAANARLTWTDKISVFRTDAETKAFIRQEEEAVSISAVAEGSELEFNENKHRYGVKASRNVGYGYWQRAALVTLT